MPNNDVPADVGALPKSISGENTFAVDQRDAATAKTVPIENGFPAVQPTAPKVVRNPNDFSRRSMLKALSGVVAALPVVAAGATSAAAGGTETHGINVPEANRDQPAPAAAYRTTFSAEDRLRHHLGMAAQAASELVGDARRWRIAMHGAPWQMSFDLWRFDLVDEPHESVPGGITVERERRVLQVDNGKIIGRVG